MKDKYRRILIFNVNWVGDVLFSTATIRNIRRNFPDSFIACVIPSRCYPVLKGNPHLDEIIIFDEKDRHRGVLAQFNFVKILKEKRFDTAFLLHRSFTRALICRLAGIGYILGYYTKKRGFLLSKKIIAPEKDTLHRIDYYLSLIEKSGLTVEDRYTEFFVSDEDSKFVEEFLDKHSLGKGGFLIAINPGANWLLKRWPKEYWARLADRLIAELGASVIITGAPQDLSLASSIKALMQEKPVIASGALNLKQLGALFKRLDLFISADTGPLHIANSVGTKRIIALFGPTSPEITGPFPLYNATVIFKDIGCKIPCYNVRCQDNRCMKAITPEEAIEKVKGLKP
ncbi:MAG: lipopolysaccharide heptosyltransferase II [Candidatus Omnitrophica bacterium]|nr:lipopolysaccharide heptosyltransferase II [Candidatus Omnitrophota bacterium]MDD5592417.1 lipopolysaccharide heptosyltransferase II [Candidatus Omnitrophota bacterium]